MIFQERLGFNLSHMYMKTRLYGQMMHFLALHILILKSVVFPAI